MATKSLRVGVLGATGAAGSYTTVELLNRGHHVVGICRLPQKLGSHPEYSHKSLDFDTATVGDFVDAFQGLDVIVNTYGPHSTGANAMVYQPTIEVVRKFIMASDLAGKIYFISMGGSGSLLVPGSTWETLLERQDYWLGFQRGISKSKGFLAYLDQLFPPDADPLRQYGIARAAEKAGKGDEATDKRITEFEDKALNNDTALPFITACRATWMFFRGNTSFRWSFLSPPLMYRPGARTGSYEVFQDVLPLTPGFENDMENVEDYFTEISSGDLAMAIPDEVEQQTKVGAHWTPVKQIQHDEAFPIFARL